MNSLSKMQGSVVKGLLMMVALFFVGAALIGALVHLFPSVGIGYLIFYLSIPVIMYIVFLLVVIITTNSR